MFAQRISCLKFLRCVVTFSLENIAWNRSPEYSFRSAPSLRGEGSEVSTIIGGILYPQNVHQKKIFSTQKKKQWYKIQTITIGTTIFIYFTLAPIDISLKCLVAICKEEIMTLTFYAKKVIRTRLRSALDSGSQLRTIICSINITLLRLRVMWNNTPKGLLGFRSKLQSRTSRSWISVD